jgi:putative peptidoglycan lipid II flippase
MGSLAQVGLALATAIGAWINLLLVLGFAVRARYLHFDRAWLISLGKFFITGVVLAAALWFVARFAALQFAQLGALRDVAVLGLLMLAGGVIYAALLLLLFGRGWLRSLLRG